MRFDPIQSKGEMHYSVAPAGICSGDRDPPGESLQAGSPSRGSGGGTPGRKRSFLKISKKSMKMRINFRQKFTIFYNFNGKFAIFQKILKSSRIFCENLGKNLEKK